MRRPSILFVCRYGVFASHVWDKSTGLSVGDVAEGVEVAKARKCPPHCRIERAHEQARLIRQGVLTVDCNDCPGKVPIALTRPDKVPRCAACKTLLERADLDRDSQRRRRATTKARKATDLQAARDRSFR